MKRDRERPEIPARRSSETSSATARLSRRYPSTRLTPGWILPARRLRSSWFRTQRSTRASLGAGPSAARQRDLAWTDAQDIVVDPLAEGRAQLALRVDESDEDRRVPRIDLVDGVRPHQEGAALHPFVPGSASDQQCPLQRHHQLDGVMAMRRGREPRPPHDHRGRPD